MKFLSQSVKKTPLITLILVDWGVRESFHLLDYLKNQTIDNSQYEITLIEFFSKKSKAAEVHKSQIDTWLLLENSVNMPYHKHVMYNQGVSIANGEICVICDSDAMVKPTFLESIIKSFAENPNIVLHIDQFRNNSKGYYPFNFPSFDEVIGEGCINNSNGKTRGIFQEEDVIHARNYGACMSVLKKNFIKIGGADEHPEYAGYICGPYDLTFRMQNAGLKEVWLDNEFTYHTWHPGAAGTDENFGWSDGLSMSGVALDALVTGRVLPLLGSKHFLGEIKYSSDFYAADQLNIALPKKIGGLVLAEQMGSAVFQPQIMKMEARSGSPHLLLEQFETLGKRSRYIDYSELEIKLSIILILAEIFYVTGEVLLRIAKGVYKVTSFFRRNGLDEKKIPAV